MENREVPQGSNNAGNTVTWLEKILSLESKYGIKGIINGFLILFIAIMMGVVAFNPGYLLQQVERFQDDRHKELVEQRKKADPIIKSLLVDLKGALNCDRAVLFETHNGGSNLTGLPFLYVDMTYDEPKAGLPKVLDEYKNLSQTRYDFMNHVYANSFWFGSIDEVKMYDMELYYRLQKANITYAGFLVLYGSDLPSGAIGVVFSCEEEPNYNKVRQELHKAGSQIAVLLQASKGEKK